jgi:hypothetical protein
MMVVAGWRGLLAEKERKTPRYENGSSDLMGWWRQLRLAAGTNFYDGPPQSSSLSRGFAACLLYKPQVRLPDGW